MSLQYQPIGINTLDVGHHIEHHFMKHLKNVMKEEGITSTIITSIIYSIFMRFIAYLTSSTAMFQLFSRNNNQLQ